MHGLYIQQHHHVVLRSGSCTALLLSEVMSVALASVQVDLFTLPGVKDVVAVCVTGVCVTAGGAGVQVDC